jgi:hypothetical protein
VILMKSCKSPELVEIEIDSAMFLAIFHRGICQNLRSARIVLSDRLEELVFAKISLAPS